MDRTRSLVGRLSSSVSTSESKLDDVRAKEISVDQGGGVQVSQSRSLQDRLQPSRCLVTRPRRVVLNRCPQAKSYPARES